MFRSCATFSIALAVCSMFVSEATAEDEGAEKRPETVRIFNALTLTIPEGWKESPTRSRIIEHEFTVPAPEGETETAAARVTMMAAGGDVEANIERWKGQFTGDAPAKVEQLEVAGQKVHLVQLEGSFKETMGGGPFAGGKTVIRDDYGMLGAIIVSDSGRKYFIKMTGPKQAIEANQKAFHTMIKGIKS